MAKLTQEELLSIFGSLKKEMKPYQKGNMKPRIDIEGKYDLWVEKQVEVLGKKKDDMYFGGLIIQSNYVGLYLMPVYTNPELKDEIAPELLKTLKGKSCFHIKKDDKELMKQVKDALKIGYEWYKKQGWY